MIAIAWAMPFTASIYFADKPVLADAPAFVPFICLAFLVVLSIKKISE